jgi:hypothetical protein
VVTGQLTHNIFFEKPGPYHEEREGRKELVGPGFNKENVREQGLTSWPPISYFLFFY